MFNILITFILFYLSRLTIKPTKWHVRPAKTQINLGIRPVWSEFSLSTWEKLKSLAIIRAHSEASDQTGWMSKTDLSLRWAQMSFCWFYHEAAHFTLSHLRQQYWFMLVQDFLLPETLRESEGFYVSVYVILQTSSNTHLYLWQVQNCCKMQLRILHGEPIAIGLKVDGKYALS